MEKIKAILGSVRFWVLTLTAGVALLEAQTTGSLNLTYTFKTIEMWLAAIATLGTMDSVATKFGAALGSRR